MKTIWEKEKMLVTTISSFPHNVFTPEKTNLIIGARSCHNYANQLNFDQPKIMSFSKRFIEQSVPHVTLDLYSVLKMNVIGIHWTQFVC